MSRFLRAIWLNVKGILFPYTPVLKIFGYKVSESEGYYLIRNAAADSIFNLFVALVLLLTAVFLNWNPTLFWILSIYMAADLLIIGIAIFQHHRYLRSNWPKRTISR